MVCNYVRPRLHSNNSPLSHRIFPFSRIILIDIRTCCHFFDLKNNFSCSAFLEQEGSHPNKAPLHVVRNWQLASFSRHRCPRLRLPGVSKSCSSSLARLCSLRPCSRESNKQARPSLRVHLAAAAPGTSLQNSRELRAWWHLSLMSPEPRTHPPGLFFFSSLTSS